MVLNDLLREMVTRDATDLFLSVGLPATASVRGIFLLLGAGTPLGSGDVISLIRASVPAAAFVSFERDGDANAAYALPGSDRFRINAFRQRGEPGMVIRRLRSTILSLEQLGAPPVLTSFALVRQGLVLVTGATGSGKSSTLASMIDHRNATTQGHIVTLEDPIEFVHPNRMGLVSQREIGFDTPTYAAGLKNVLRQSPSVVLIGEIRDRETAEAALHFADTGHLVLSTLHSANAAQTLERLSNLFPQEAERNVRHQLSLNLRGVVSQRLLPRKDGSGRVLAVEVMVSTPHIAALIKNGKIDELKGAMIQGALDGCQTFDGHIFSLLRAGLITADTAAAYADSHNDMLLRIRLEAGVGERTSGIRIV